MKKQAICLSALSLVLLTGCSGAKADVSNSSDALFTVGDTSVTVSDEYELIKSSTGGSMTLELAKHAVYDKVVPATDEMKEAAQEEYDSLEESYTDLESQLQSLGYEDAQAYIDAVLLPAQQETAIATQYFTDNAKAIKKEYKPSIAIILQCDSRENANNALKAIKNGDDLDTVYEKYTSESSSFTNEETVITTLTDTVPTRVINQLYKADETGVIDEVFENDDDDAAYYYVAILKSNSYKKNIDTFKETIAAGDDFETEMYVYYFTKYDFEVYDQDVFDYLKTNNPEYLIKYPELAESDEDE